MLLPGCGEESAQRLAEEIQPNVSLRVSCAAWAEGDSGAAVIARARTADGAVRARVFD